MRDISVALFAVQVAFYTLGVSILIEHQLFSPYEWSLRILQWIVGIICTLLLFLNLYMGYRLFYKPSRRIKHIYFLFCCAFFLIYNWDYSKYQWYISLSDRVFLVGFLCGTGLYILMLFKGLYQSGGNITKVST